MEPRAYAQAGVDTGLSGSGVAALVEVLRSIDPGRERRSVVGPGQFAAVVRLDGERGLALATDGVGSKLIVAQRVGRYETVGIDCVAMNANDLVCVGAEPLALLDYVAVEEPDEAMLRALGEGLKAGAEQAGVEIPGGELAQVPELIRGHPSPRGFDLVGTCVGIVALDHILTGARIEPGDALIGIPSSGVHSNGVSLARSALPDLDEHPPALDGRSVGEALLEPTVIYVRAALELLRSAADVRALAHITGDGLLNLLRVEAQVGFAIDRPLPVPPIFELIAERSAIPPAELYEVFNMGCGFCCVVPEVDAEVAVATLSKHHRGAAVIGRVTAEAGVVRVPSLDLRLEPSRRTSAG